MRKVISLMASLVASLGLLALPVTAGAASPPAFGLTPFTFVGALGDCGTGYPAGTDTVVSKWDSTTGNPTPSILLEKIGPTADCSAAGVEITTPLIGGPATGVTELNFDYQNGGHCGAGAPRFNIVSGSKVAFLGCAGGTQTSAGPGWTHVEFNSADILAAETGAGFLPTGSLTELQIIFDEGTDTAGGTPGIVNIDNVSLNGAVVGSPTSPQTKDDCKNGGWQNFNPSFKNQGDCVSFVATGGKNPPFTPKH
jgi:hypothetical protein